MPRVTRLILLRDGVTYPVFRRAEESPLAQQVHTVLETSFAQKVLRLDRYARNLLLREPGRGDEQRLKEPMYLLLSGEEGAVPATAFGSKTRVAAGVWFGRAMWTW